MDIWNVNGFRMVEELIWYNPELKVYQKGSRAEFEKLVGQSDHSSEFVIYYRLDTVSARMADTIIHQLNTDSTAKSGTPPDRLFSDN